jgi:hypothetical protein
MLLAVIALAGLFVPPAGHGAVVVLRAVLFGVYHISWAGAGSHPTACPAPPPLPTHTPHTHSHPPPPRPAGGVRALYAGLSPTLARAFPANAAQWLAWELCLQQMRGSGGAAAGAD